MVGESEGMWHQGVSETLWLHLYVNLPTLVIFSQIQNVVCVIL